MKKLNILIVILLTCLSCDKEPKFYYLESESKISQGVIYKHVVISNPPENLDSLALLVNNYSNKKFKIKKMYYNLIEYYKIVDAHRKIHLKPLRTSQKLSNWEILFFEKKSYNLYQEGKLKFDEIKLLDEYGKKPEYDTDKVFMVTSGSTRTWMFAGLMCLWEVTAQYGCTIFYKQIKKYDKLKINPNDAPLY